MHIDWMEKYFTDPGQLPKVFTLLTDIAELLIGSFGGASGTGLEKLVSIEFNQSNPVGVHHPPGGFAGLLLSPSRIFGSAVALDPAVLGCLTALEVPNALSRRNSLYEGPGAGVAAAREAL